VTELTIHDAQQIYDVRIELEPFAFFLAGPGAHAQYIPELRDMAEKAAIESRAGDLSAFFENHHLRYEFRTGFGISLRRIHSSIRSPSHATDTSVSGNNPSSSMAL
jgi:hypothetical protein